MQDLLLTQKTEMMEYQLHNPDTPRLVRRLRTVHLMYRSVAEGHNHVCPGMSPGLGLLEGTYDLYDNCVQL